MSPKSAGLCYLLTALAATSAPASGQARTVELDYVEAQATQRVRPDDLQLRVGEADGVALYHVTHVLPRRDGSFVVVNSGTSELFAFDSSGERIWSSGRGGDGPGEFMDIQGAATLPGDSIVVLDPIARRVSLLGPDGGFIDSFQVEVAFEGAGFPTLLLSLADGTLLLGHAESRTTAPQPEAIYLGQRLFRYSTAGDRISAEGLSVPRIERFVQALPEELGRGSVAYWDLAFGRRMTVRAAPEGGVLMGDGTEWTIERRTADGTVLGGHRLGRAIEPVTEGDRAAYRRRAIEGAEQSGREVAEREAEEMPYPATKPAYRRFEVDDAGRLWLESYSSSESDEGTVWIRLDPSTRIAATVRFPPRYRALAFRDDLAYGVWRDDLDVEYVHVYRIASKASPTGEQAR